MKARDIRQFFIDKGKEHSPWIDWKNTRDIFMAGNPNAKVRCIAVAWMATQKAMEKAVQMGADLFVSHESLFYDFGGMFLKPMSDPVNIRKKKFAQSHNLTIVRIHDSWDEYPEIGVGPSLAKLLGFEEPAKSIEFRRVYSMKSTRLDDFSVHVRKKLNLSQVDVMGKMGSRVSRVGLSIGLMSINSMRLFITMKPDVIVAGELSHSGSVRYLQDAGMNLILTDHAASENPGIRQLAQFIQKTFCTKTHYVEVGCPF